MSRKQKTLVVAATLVAALGITTGVAWAHTVRLTCVNPAGIELTFQGPHQRIEKIERALGIAGFECESEEIEE